MNWKWKRSGLLVCAVCIGAGVLSAGRGASAQSLRYPPTKKIAHTDTYFGTTVADPYRWLEDDNSAQTAAWVTAQNKLTFDYLSKIPYRSQIAARLKQVVNYPRYSAPIRKGDYIFFTKNSGLQNQSVLYVQKGLDGTPEVLLDPNTFSKDGTIALHGFELSKDGRYAAYSVSAIPGSDWEETRVMDIAARKTLPDTLKVDQVFHARLARKRLLLQPLPAARKRRGTHDGRGKPGRVLSQIGRRAGAGRKNLRRPGPTPSAAWASARPKTSGSRCFTSATTRKKGNALLFRDENKAQSASPASAGADGSHAAFTPLVPDVTEDRYTVVDNEGDKFLIQTNHNAPNQKLMLCNPADPDEKHWQTVLPERAEPLSALTTAGDKLIASYFKDVTTVVEAHSREGKLESTVTLPAIGTASGFGGEKTDKEVFYTFTSLQLSRHDLPLQPCHACLVSVPRSRNPRLPFPGLSDRGSVLQEQGRYARPDVSGVQKGNAARRRESDPAVRIWRLQHHAHARIQRHAHRLAGAGWRIRAGQSQGWGRVRRAVARGRDAPEQAERV